MNLFKKKKTAYDDFIPCLEHLDIILHDKNSKCPLCKEVRIIEYYITSKSELRIKYENLHKAALETSPEILI